MATSSDEAQQTLQREVQRLLGRCLLRLQQYERLIKTIIAHHEISGPIHALKTVQAELVANTARQTLGTLVGDLLGSYVVPSEIGTSVKAMGRHPEDVISFGMRMHLELSDADFAQTENELRELVLLRNNLVHHFIDQHDLGSLDGCRSAHDALVAAYSRIDKHFEQLRGWAVDMEEGRRLLAEVIRSDMFRELVVDGIGPDGTVTWPAAGIVSALREAAGELADDGWASIARASSWIAERYSEQLPAKYGCSSWRQVVHESRIFELRYFEVDGQRSAWYREKKAPRTQVELHLQHKFVCSEGTKTPPDLTGPAPCLKPC